jgi:serine/threonine protein kinase
MNTVNAAHTTESTDRSGRPATPGRPCTACGTPFNPRSTANLCPACLLSAALSDAPDDDEPQEPTGTDESAAERFGPFDLFGEAGRGGMGIVYRARQRGVNRWVALKLLQAGRMLSASGVERFQREATAIARLEHPGILPLYATGEHRGQPWCAVKWMDGGSLAQRLDEFRLPRPGESSSATPATVARFIRKIALAIHHAHQRGVLHRDLKPGNILLDSADEPAVADFGLARTLDSDSALTRTGAFVGSPAYTAPEQAASDGREVTVAADLYGLGAILYELVTGRPPFTGKDTFETLRHVVESVPTAPHALNPAVPRDLETICLKCLEKEPAKRYPTAQALADDLDRFLNNEPILARPVTRLERIVRWARRKPALATSLLLVLVLVLVLAIASPIAAYRINEARRQAAQEADTARAMRWLSPVFAAQGRYEEAIEIRREGLDREGRLLSADAPWLHMASYQQANLLARIGQWSQAAQLFAEFLPHADPAKSLRPHETASSASAGPETSAALYGTLTRNGSRRLSSPSHAAKPSCSFMDGCLSPFSMNPSSPVPVNASFRSGRCSTTPTVQPCAGTGRLRSSVCGLRSVTQPSTGPPPYRAGRTSPARRLGSWPSEASSVHRPS